MKKIDNVNHINGGASAHSLVSITYLADGGICDASMTYEDCNEGEWGW